MFYQNKSILTTAITFMVNNTDNHTLMRSINRLFGEVDTSKIIDVDMKRLCETVKQISNDLSSKSIYTPEAARMYISNSDLPEDTKKMVLSNTTKSSEKVIKDFIKLFAKLEAVPEMEKVMDTIEENFDRLKKSGINNIENNFNSFIESSHHFDDLVKEMTKSIDEDVVFVVDISKDEVVSLGMDRLARSIEETDNNKIKTGMWLDNLTGGGFLNNALYVVAAVAGGFKSGLMQNIAEHIALAMDTKKVITRDGLTPAVYYLNLEMSDVQMIERKLSFYGSSLDEIEANMQLNNTTLTHEISQLLIDKGAKFPIIYEQGFDNYPIGTIKQKLKDFEKSGYQIMFLIIDYADLIKTNITNLDALERNEALTLKMKELRQLSMEFRMPVLTAAQLNRAAEDLLKSHEHRAASEDILLKVSSSQLGKAYAVKSIPEQIWIVYKSTINDTDYISIVVDKDRQNKAFYVPDPKSIFKKKDNKTGHKASNKRNVGRVHYVSPLVNFRISENYSNTIRDFENVDEITAFDALTAGTADE